ncbi:4'-phosphopantetheinyl transferase family protein [Roseateles sp. BYS180W]|uniref:4'-phosphopantetheinyl transferase family protein n=1 Tax=Roseateles rivi TaxID=3299028 RepID=A0ABW7FQY2_9BURK
MSSVQLALWRVEGLSWPDPTRWLHEAELQRLGRISHAGRQHQYLAGRWGLRLLLQRQPAALALVQAMHLLPSGQTVLPQGAVSLSHAGGWLACAYTPEGRVGVDIECQRPRVQLLEQAQIWCGPLQCQQLSTLPPAAQLAQFYRWWTLKEAWLKARGQGLDFEQMRALSFELADATKADAAVTALPQSEVVLALCGSPGDGLALPSALQEQPLEWEILESRPCFESRP